MNNDFGSLVMRFANDFHSWLRHSWKLLANRLTRDPKIVIHGNSCIILYISIGSSVIHIMQYLINTLRSRQNSCHFADDMFKFIFFNKNVWIATNISLKFVPKILINDVPALVQIMAWRRPGDKPLSEPMLVSLLTHICITRPQWVKSCSENQELSCCKLCGC